MQRWPLSEDGLGISIQELGLLLGHMKAYLRDSRAHEHTGCTEDEGHRHDTEFCFGVLGLLEETQRLEWAVRCAWHLGTGEAAPVPPTHSDKWASRAVVLQTVKSFHPEMATLADQHQDLCLELVRSSRVASCPDREVRALLPGPQHKVWSPLEGADAAASLKAPGRHLHPLS